MADDPIALAGRPFQATSIPDRNHTAVIADQLTSLECRSGLGHSGSPHAEHLPQKLVGEGKLVSIHAITDDKKPARKTLLDGMCAITGGGLRDLRHERLRIALHKLPKSPFAVRLSAEDRDVQALALTGDLDDGPSRGSGGAEEHRESHEPFIADGADFDRMAIGEGEYRGDGVDGEIHCIDRPIRLPENLLQFHGHRRQLGPESCVVLGRKGSEEMVCVLLGAGSRFGV